MTFVEQIVARFADPGDRYDPSNHRNFRSDLEKILSVALGRRGQTVGTMADADATPDVTNYNVWVTANTGATTITALDGGAEGQEVQILAGDGNTTVQDGASLQLNGGSNFAMSQNDTLRLIKIGGVWYEIARSAN